MSFEYNELAFEQAMDEVEYEHAYGLLKSADVSESYGVHGLSSDDCPF